jgi:S-DNA-T family DNA segregation ATPase FtsK/SpoIIIE
MTHVLSVTEVRNALRCPRVFALGRLRGKQVSFPLGASSLGSAFHRIVETLARSVAAPPVGLQRLEASATRDEVAAELSSWCIELLAAELELTPAYVSMPAEVDDLAEALRAFAAYLARRAHGALKPAEALKRFLKSPELSAESTIDLGGTSVRLAGRIDALHAPANGEAEVVEYKLTDGANEEVDRAQVALYRTLLSKNDVVATPVILRFNPALTETRLAPETADALVAKRLVPLLRAMTGWIDAPLQAPPTERADLCPACPLRGPCAETYRDLLPRRDDPPSSANRPRPAETGEVKRETAAPVVTDVATPSTDAEGHEEAERIKRRIIAILKKLGVNVTSPKPAVVGARMVSIEVSAASGKISAIDKAADDVKHHLHAEDGVVAEYRRDGGLRVFGIERKRPRPVLARPTFEKRAGWLAQRPGRFIVGEELDGSVLGGDLSDPSCCHVLIAGQAGSGKSVLLRCIATSLAQYQPPSAIRFTLIDPKRVTFQSLLSGLSSHLAGPLCIDVEEALPVLDDLVGEMEDRYALFVDAKVQDIQEFNEGQREADRLARHVVLVDEFADLMVDKGPRDEFVSTVRRLGAKARAAGIHLILATQRPTKESVPMNVKANLSGRIALKVASALESKIVLDSVGAESLLGRGDLLANLGDGVHRAQAPIEGAP